MNVHELYKDLNQKCKHCGCTKGAHSASAYYSERYQKFIPYNYCPGHEGRMDWDESPGTTFKAEEEEESK